MASAQSLRNETGATDAALESAIATVDVSVHQSVIVDALSHIRDLFPAVRAVVHGCLFVNFTGSIVLH